MTKPYSVSRLRANLYKVVDQVLETGVPVEVERKGQRVRIVAADTGQRFTNLVAHPEYLRTDPESLVHMDWSPEWRP
ncbi:MAG TPA: type II toxin-antitoxin system Phd/YefM family antitoxin [Longimicrobiales bacterium]|nr:type II toxin-antitoxin system Phd/YefM family antitoxin [Longimicrobiales bacterium]